MRIGCIWLRIGTSGRFCEHGNQPAVSIKDREILHQLKEY
jgi:hypothetical protein